MKTEIVSLTTLGQLDTLGLRDAVRPDMLPHEMEIEVEAAALNFKDVLLALGLLPASQGSAPSLGFECVGRVRKVGAEVSGFSPGDEVLALGAGCLATKICIAADTVRAKPKGIDALSAVTLPVAFVTATYALEELARLRLGERVLIHAATGGVGLAAVQIAQQTGAEIFATAGSEAKREHLRSLGIKHVMDSRTPSFAEQILDTTTGTGVDVVLNSLSGVLLEQSLAVLAPHGRFIELGARDAIEGRALALSLFARGASFCAVGYSGSLPRLGSRFGEVMARAEIGEFRPLPKTVFAATAIEEAFSHLARARHIGKVVIAFKGEVASTGPSEPDDPTRDFLLPAEGVDLFELCLAARRSHTVVSKVPLAPRLLKGAALPAVQLAQAPAAVLSEKTATSREARPPRRRYHPRPALEVEFVAPRSEFEGRLSAAWAHHLGIEAVGVHDDFFALGGDSLLAVQLGHHIRTELKIDLPAHLLLESPTVAALAQRLGSPQPEPDPSRHLVRLASGPGDPLFLVHPVGGHVYFYLPLAKGLDGVAPVYGLQAQGVDGEAPPLGSISEMAASYITAMRKTQPKGPYRIGGASFGGVVAFEIAQQLLGSGETIGLLAMLDSPGPGALPVGFTSNAEILAYLLNHGSTEEVHLMKLSTLSEEEMLRYFLTHGGGRERLPPRADIDSVRHFLRLFRTNFDALLKYRPRPCAASGLFFSALDPDAVNPVGLERAWAPLLQSLEVVPVPGNHTTINLQPNVQIIIDRLRLALARPAV